MRVTVIASLIITFLFFPFSAYAQEGDAQVTTPEETYSTPEPYIERAKREGPVQEISLKDAIRLALTNNLELQIENYNEELNRERVFGTKGFYDPTLEFYLGWNSLERPSTSNLDGLLVPVTLSKQWEFQTQFQQNVKWGGAFLASFDNRRSKRSNDRYFFNPEYGTNLNLQYTQPLWRGFRQTQTERQLRLFNLDTDISDSQFRQRVSEIIQQVQNQYWELAYSIANHETRRGSLELAIVQYRDNKKRVEIGVLAPIEITSSRAEMAIREQELIQSRVSIINAQNSFKGLVAPDPRDDIWNVSFIPTDRPEVRDVQIGMEDAIQTALAKRPELEQINFEVAKTGVDRKYYKKDGKPAVNLEVGVTSQGTAGISDFVQNPLYGGVTRAWEDMVQFKWLNWRAGVRVEIPLKNRANEANLAQVEIAERRLRSRMKSVQQDIMVDVRNAYEGISTQKEGLAAARVARELSEEQLSGETKRFEAGLSTNFEVLRYQRDLATAQVSELRAMVDYQLALTALQKATFTIVDDSDIILAKSDEGEPSR